jgi:hypothetical protein
MLRATFEVCVPWEWSPGRLWHITGANLKMALKYGVFGPLAHRPWGDVNRSVAFDSYAQTRGPSRGVPGIEDFMAGLTMNSRLNGDDAARLLLWLPLQDTQRKLRGLRDQLLTSSGLDDASESTIDCLGGFVDDIIHNDEILPGLSTAKTFKWLAAWAPDHIPMLDRILAHDILSYVEKPYRERKTAELLRRFRKLLLAHLDGLHKVGEHLVRDLSGAIPRPLSPIRVLDSLLWFDWNPSPRFRKRMSEWVQYESDSAGTHKLTAAGEQSESNHNQDM